MTRKTPGRHFRKGISLVETATCPNNEGAGLWPSRKSDMIGHD